MPAIDPGDLTAAVDQGFPLRTAEKVWRLLQLLRKFQARPDSRGKFTLKGGTALNIFHRPEIPRLSVDIDLMATGFPGAAPRTPHRRRAIRSVEAACRELRYHVTSASLDGGAGMSFSCEYRDQLGTPDRIKVDLDLLNRMTFIAPVSEKGPGLFAAEDLEFPLVDEAELFGQKLTAVAWRARPRDLYDMCTMLRGEWDRRPRARSLYLAYSFLNNTEWNRLAYPVRLQVLYPVEQLGDVLRVSERPPSLEEIRRLAHQRLEGAIPSFTAATAEEEALRGQLLRGEREAFGRIAGEEDPTRCRTLANHPGLLWRLRQASRPPRPP